ncbi:MAG: RNA polymerase subunit sigma [Clostridium sp.]
MYSIENELAFYKFRAIEIEDLKLKVEEIKLGDNFNEISYEEKVKSSKKCTGNDKDMNEIDRLEKTIKRNTLANKRVDNLLRVLDPDELEVVQIILIDKVSKTKAQLKINMTRRNINRKLDQALNRLKHYIS